MRGLVPIALVVAAMGCGDVVKHIDSGSGDDAGGGDDGGGVDGPPPVIDAAPGTLAITAVTPDWGSTDGGTNVKITGSGFTGASLAVTFGTASATTVTVVSDTELRVVTPAGPHMLVPLSVTTGAGTVQSAMRYRYLAPLYSGDGQAQPPASATLYRINPTTGASTAIGLIGFSVTGLAISKDGILFGAAIGNAGPPVVPPRLIRIDPYTGAGTLIANLTSGVSDIAFEGDRLLGWRGGQMAEIDKTTGTTSLFTATFAGTGGRGVVSTGVGTMAYAPVGANGALYRVNTTTGVATAGPTMNHPTAGGISAMTFVGGTMMAVVNGSGLAAIDNNTGAVTVRGALPPRTDALAGIPTQPPLARAVDEPEVAITEASTAGVLVEASAPIAPSAPAPIVVVGGHAVVLGELLALGTDRAFGDVTRRTVQLAALTRFAKTARTVELVGPDGATRRVRVDSAGLALVPNNRGELKLVDTRLGTKKLFGPIVELRFAR